MSTGFLSRGRGRDSLRRHPLPNALVDERRSFKPEKQDRYLTGAPANHGSVAEEQTQLAQDEPLHQGHEGANPSGTTTFGPVAELEDAPVSETGGGSLVGVQIPPGPFPPGRSSRPGGNVVREPELVESEPNHAIPLRSTGGRLSYKQETGVRLPQREPPSGHGVTWQPATFGMWRLQVQILLPGPAIHHAGGVAEARERPKLEVRARLPAGVPTRPRRSSDRN